MTAQTRLALLIQERTAATAQPMIVIHPTEEPASFAIVNPSLPELQPYCETDSRGIHEPWRNPPVTAPRQPIAEEPPKQRQGSTHPSTYQDWAPAPQNQLPGAGSSGTPESDSPRSGQE